MKSFSEVIQAFGGARQFGEAIGIPNNHARAIAARRSIPPEYWEATVRAAKQRGIGGITGDAFLKMAARRRKTFASAGEPAQ